MDSALFTNVALGVVLLSASFLIALASVSFFAPVLARHFLMGFAATPVRHFVELTLRLVVGVAFIGSAGSMTAGPVFLVFGWVLVGTTIGLALIPWQTHRRFAQRAVPLAAKYISLLGIASLVGGVCIMVSVFYGSAA